jgi:hypothetical protein
VVNIAFKWWWWWDRGGGREGTAEDQQFEQGKVDRDYPEYGDLGEHRCKYLVM